MPRPRTGSEPKKLPNGKWLARLDWTDRHGKPHCKKKQAPNTTAARALVAQWIQDLKQRGETYVDAERMTFAQLAAKYQAKFLVAPLWRDGIKITGQKDWKGARSRLKVLITHFGKQPIRDITAGSVFDFRSLRLEVETKRKAKERSLTDVHRSLTLLRTVFNYAIGEKWLLSNPVTEAKGVIQVALEKKRTRVLSTTEQRALLEACRTPRRQHLFPLIITALDSGCRRNELFSLCWRNLDLEAGNLHVLASDAKDNESRTISLEPVTVDALRRLKAQAPPDESARVFGIQDNCTKAFNAAMREAGIADARFHDLRATAITFWLLRGLRTEFAMLRSGHSTPKIFLRYVRICAEIQEKQKAGLEKWELGESLSELARQSEFSELSDTYAAEQVRTSMIC
jgi:integrase